MRVLFENLYLTWFVLLVKAIVAAESKGICKVHPLLFTMRREAPERGEIQSLTRRPRGMYCMGHSSGVASALGRFPLAEVSSSRLMSVREHCNRGFLQLI